MNVWRRSNDLFEKDFLTIHFEEQKIMQQQ